MLIGGILVFASGVLFGATPLVTMLLYGSGLNTITVSLFRYLFVIPFILIINLFTHRSLKIEKENAFKIVTHLGLISVATNLLLAGSYNFISTGTATTLHFLYPVVVILISIFYYHDKISKQIMYAVILVLIGVVCFMDSIDSDGAIGVVMASLSSVTYSIYILQLEKTRLNRLDPTVLSFYLAITTIVVLSIASLFIQPLSLNLSVNQILLFILLGLITLLALMMFQLGSRYLGAKLSALLSLSEPITSMVVGLIFLNEPLLFIKIVGSISILAAILIVTYRKK